MRLKRLILFGLLINTGLLYAQSDFRPGYIVKDAGDTLYGEIDYRGDIFMNFICRFKTRDHTIIEYSPDDILTYRFIDSRYYITKDINCKKVFLEWLIKGKVSVFYLRDADGDHYYVEKDGIGLTELPFKGEIVTINGKLVYVESKKHIGLLHYYMQDAPELHSYIDSLKKPESQNLIKLAEAYHNKVCKEEQCVVYEKKLPFIKILFEPFAGITKYTAYYKLVSEWGGNFYLWAPRTNEKLYFKTGFIYSETSENDVVLSIVKIPIQFQYIYRAYRIQPKISAGINFLYLKLDNQRHGDVGNTLSINCGLNYKISSSVSLSSSFNSDYTPLFRVIPEEDAKFDIISYSITFGLMFDI